MNSRLIADIKGRLPISSRSLRGFRAQDDARYAQLLQVIDDQQKALGKAQESIDRLEKQCRGLNETLEYVHDSNSVMYWQLFRGDHETTEQAQLRFFRGTLRSVLPGSRDLLLGYRRYSAGRLSPAGFHPLG